VWEIAHLDTPLSGEHALRGRLVHGLRSATRLPTCASTPPAKAWAPHHRRAWHAACTARFAVDSYISSEVIARLRLEQERLREGLAELGQSAQRSGSARLAAQVDRVATLFRAHERLVGALLEAVEPDLPAFDDTEE